jgi:zinc ribbon protein
MNRIELKLEERAVRSLSQPTGATFMATEFLTGTRERDHDLSLTITGDVESLRPRLIEALKTLGYTVLGEQPLYAKRGAQGCARWDCSFDGLDYPTRLTISLKQLNDIAVVATFHYELKTYLRITRGDRQTLQREAEAIAALANERLAISACPSCATPVTDDSHFCRRCGAPLALEAPELEVLRLTRKSRTAYRNLFLGIVVLFFAAVLFVPLFWWWAEPRVFRSLLLLGSTFGAFGLIALLQGIWQLHYALNPKPAELTKRSQPPFSAPHTKALPSIPARASVTEGTTELLDSFASGERRQAEPLPRKSLDTGEVVDTDIDDDRLM